jgi:hypothetical protein
MGLFNFIHASHGTGALDICQLLARAALPPLPATNMKSGACRSLDCTFRAISESREEPFLLRMLGIFII